MDGMKTNTTNLLRILFGVALGIVLTAGVTNAQTSAAPNSNAAKVVDAKSAKVVDAKDAKKPAKTDEKKTTAKKPEKVPTSESGGEDAGSYTVMSTLEFGYRGQRVDGDINKFKSDLNYKAGPRLFDSTFLMKSKDGKGDLFDTLLVTSSGWGADPNGTMRISKEQQT